MTAAYARSQIQTMGNAMTVLYARKQQATLAASSTESVIVNAGSTGAYTVKFSTKGRKSTGNPPEPSTITGGGAG